MFIGGVGMPFNVRDSNLIITTTNRTITNSLISSSFLLRQDTPVNVTGLNQGTITFVRKTLLINNK